MRVKKVNSSSRSNHSEMVSIRPFSPSSPRVVVLVCLPPPSLFFVFENVIGSKKKSSPIYYLHSLQTERNKRRARLSMISNDKRSEGLRLSSVAIGPGGWVERGGQIRKYSNPSAILLLPRISRGMAIPRRSSSKITYFYKEFSSQSTKARSSLLNAQ